MAYITPDGTIVETGSESFAPTSTSFDGPVGGELDDLALVPELDASTKGYWQAFGPGLGLRTRPPWLVIGGLGFLAYTMLKKR